MYKQVEIQDHIKKCEAGTFCDVDVLSGLFAFRYTCWNHGDKTPKHFVAEKVKIFLCIYFSNAENKI